MKYIWLLIKRFFSNWNEFITVPFAIALFFVVTPLMRIIDPTAGAYDAGYFVKPLMVTIHFLIYHAVAWLMIKITFPGIFDYLEEYFDNDVNEGENSKWVGLLLFFGYLFALIVLSLSI